jgi:hypothetical protein
MIHTAKPASPMEAMPRSSASVFVRLEPDDAISVFLFFRETYGRPGFGAARGP